ncbi:MAG: hypothetical protein ACK583_05605 [Cyanobacteriota bacterium]
MALSLLGPFSTGGSAARCLQSEGQGEPWASRAVGPTRRRRVESLQLRNALLGAPGSMVMAAPPLPLSCPLQIPRLLPPPSTLHRQNRWMAIQRACPRGPDPLP